MFSTCFYTSFLSRDFLSFSTDSLYTCSYSHLPLHSKHLFAEIAYPITQVPQVFDTRFLPFYTTCAIRCTCQKPNIMVTFPFLLLTILHIVQTLSGPKNLSFFSIYIFFFSLIFDWLTLYFSLFFLFFSFEAHLKPKAKEASFGRSFYSPFQV